MADSTITASAILHRPLLRGSHPKRHLHLAPITPLEFHGKRLACPADPSSSSSRRPRDLPAIRAVAKELTRQAPSDPRDNRSIDLVEPSRLWPPHNKADNPSLHNPLLRQHRMGCGWLTAIIELEGVILEDDPDLERQAWLALSHEEGRSPPPSISLSRAEGMKSEQALSEVLLWSRNPSELRRLASRKEEIHRSLLPRGGPHRLRPGSSEFLTALLNHKIPVTVASTRPRSVLEESLEAVGLLGFFDAVVAGDDVCLGKPDPEMFAYAAQLMDFIPERCVVFGNSNTTVEASHAAGMKCVAIASKHPVYELGAADLVVRRLDELSVVDLKNLADVEMPEFDLQTEEEESPRRSLAVGRWDPSW